MLLGYADLPLGVTATHGYAVPVSFDFTYDTLPLSTYLDIQLAPPLSPPTAGVKPVREPPLEPPQPTDGASITVALPQTNAYLGSGSLGVVRLQGGGLVLGSGSLG